MCFALFLLCDVILRALLCLGGAQVQGTETERGGHSKEWGWGWRRGKVQGRGRDKQRETENYIAVCKKTV